MATAIYFDGKRINVPQAVSKIDASALASKSPSSVGIVALVGVAEGGAPQTADESLADATNPNTVQARYRSGELRTAALFAFDPSSDAAINGGAQKEILVKVNPATQSAVILPDGNGADSLDLSSKDYGLFTAQVNIEVEAGTTKGLLYTVTFEDTVETFDDVGGDSVFDVLFAPGAAGYDTAVATIDASAFTIAATKDVTGLTTERAADIPVAGVIDAASSSAGDTTQVLTVYGLSASGAVISESIALNGTTNVQGLVSFTKVLGARLDAAAVGTVTVSDYPVTTTLFTFAPSALTKGILDMTAGVAAGVLTAAIDSDTAVDFAFVGTDATGLTVGEAFDMTSGNTTPVVGTITPATITTLLLGDIAAARTISISLNAFKTLHSVYTTVAKVVDKLNSLSPFTANASVSNYTTFLMTAMDYHAASTRPSVSVMGTAADFYADLYYGAKTLTEQSLFVDAARSTGADLPPVATGGSVFLVGGSEGTTTISDWQAAFTALEKRRYNILVPLSRDPAVHALALAHLLAKQGRLRSECNGYVGIATADGVGETRSNIQSQIQALNTRHLCAIAQEVQRYDPITGEATYYPPYMLAAIAAGMQAGSAIAEPLTRKLINALNLRNNSSWSVENDVSDLIDRGLMMGEKVDGVGVRWVRSITTHLADDNLAFVEMSSNESLNTFVYEFRTAIEQMIGSRGLARTVGAIASLAKGRADAAVTEGKIFGWKNVLVEQVGDVFPVSIEVALVNPVNFIPITVHLSPSRATTAA